MAPDAAHQGIGTVVGAFAGGHAICMAAITVLGNGGAFWALVVGVLLRLVLVRRTTA